MPLLSTVHPILPLFSWRIWKRGMISKEYSTSFSCLEEHACQCFNIFHLACQHRLPELASVGGKQPGKPPCRVPLCPFPEKGLGMKGEACCDYLPGELHSLETLFFLLVYRSEIQQSKKALRKLYFPSKHYPPLGQVLLCQAAITQPRSSRATSWASEKAS